MAELFLVCLLQKLEREVSSRDFLRQAHPGQHIPVKIQDWSHPDPLGIRQLWPAREASCLPCVMQVKANTK